MQQQDFCGIINYASLCESVLSKIGDKTMTAFEYILGAALILVAVALVIIILFQKDRASTGANAFETNNESVYGKNSGRSKTAIMQKLTLILAVVLVILTVVINVVVATNN